MKASIFSLRTPVYGLLLVVACFFSGPASSHADEANETDFMISQRLSSVLTPAFPMFEARSDVNLSVAADKTGSAASMDMGDAHKYMGYTTLVLAAGAAFSSSNEDVHEPLGYAAAGLATLTCISGYLEYNDYFNMDDGWSKTNIHIVSGIAATAGFIVTAILGADGDDHGGIGGVSTALMVVPIVILKW